jgi:hypothetical protein
VFHLCYIKADVDRQNTYRWPTFSSDRLELGYTSLGYDGCDYTYLSRSKGIAFFRRTLLLPSK